jgi:hypothetical protein
VYVLLRPVGVPQKTAEDHQTTKLLQDGQNDIERQNGRTNGRTDG